MIGYSIAGLRDSAPEGNEGVAFLVQLELVWILAPLDQDAAHIGAADETVALRGNRMGENDGQSLAEKNLNRLKQRVPLHQGPVGRQRMKQGALHIGHAAPFGEPFVEGLSHFTCGLFRSNWDNSRHAAPFLH